MLISQILNYRFCKFSIVKFPHVFYFHFFYSKQNNHIFFSGCTWCKCSYCLHRPSFAFHSLLFAFYSNCCCILKFLSSYLFDCRCLFFPIFIIKNYITLLMALQATFYHSTFSIRANLMATTDRSKCGFAIKNVKFLSVTTLAFI